MQQVQEDILGKDDVYMGGFKGVGSCNVNVVNAVDRAPAGVIITRPKWPFTYYRHELGLVCSLLRLYPPLVID